MKIDENPEELLALGFANVAGAFMAGFPITGGFSRSLGYLLWLES